MKCQVASSSGIKFIAKRDGIDGSQQVIDQLSNEESAGCMYLAGDVDGMAVDRLRGQD